MYDAIITSPTQAALFLQPAVTGKSTKAQEKDLCDRGLINQIRQDEEEGSGDFSEKHIAPNTALLRQIISSLFNVWQKMKKAETDKRVEMRTRQKTKTFPITKDSNNSPTMAMGSHDSIFN